MSLSESVRIKVPASTANLGPGFDTLGMALSLYAWIEMKQDDRTAFHLYGDEMKGVPEDKSNLIYKVAQMVFDEAGISVPELAISMCSDIPLTRGLGSSASAIVGSLAAANALIGSPLPDSKLFDMATNLEKHPDNVGASLFGGIIAAAWDGSHADYVRIEPPVNLDTLVVIPDFHLSTAKAREALPEQFSLSDAVYNISRSSLMTAALASGRLDLIGAAMRDRIHQPYRAALVPGMAEILDEAPNRGALGIALSGAGPTLIALIQRGDERVESLKSYLMETMKKEGISASSLLLQPDVEGVKVLDNIQSTSFLDMIRGEVTT
ncbi:homoserine kinase [Paenibacillus uliginis N3/975]|uniref:Homoserine kinase n=1 Tax=Paenibacillus uliginis N3/975 TaxID=1313296 RepID=A0A1X7HNX6_9BACL|nr:homoserine kinase [Paenibacillus uliginis]SMF89168.1 homoserine kinase [Paenibacillus uliginis N3/975]